MKKGHRGKAGRRKRANRPKRYALTAFCVALVAIMLALGIYIAQWYLNLGRIRADSDRYAGLYSGREPEATQVPVEQVTEMPAETATAIFTDVPTPSEMPSPEPTSVATEAPTSKPTAIPTEVPTPEPTPIPTETPTAEPTPVPSEIPTPVPVQLPGADMPVVEDVPIPTPNADTLVLALPTAPPVQSGFSELLVLNPETVGFLDIDGMLSLPVVQRENDNEFYLNHRFEGVEAQEGTLFLDGMNRLVPEDDCLIVYGHNMKNRTMFGRLSAYGDPEYLRKYPVIHFDTLYEDRSYVIFAAFTASMDPRNARYFDVRNFIFDETEFDKFVLKLQSRSRFRVPLDVRYGDRLLLLVTCDYTNDEGRFILALRQLREGESEGDAWALAMQATAK